jgi:hypothetical protein
MFNKLGVVSCLSLLAAQAHAAVPAAVTSAITDAGTDMATVAGAVFVAIIGLLGFKLMRRAAN